MCRENEGTYPPTYSFAPVRPATIFLVATCAIYAGLLELALEDLISQTVPSDLIQPVPKGINGADNTADSD
jgi:hypothetical protein